MTVLAEKYIPLDAEISPNARAVGYHLEALSAEPGQELVASLAWRPQGELEQNRTLFAHLIGPERHAICWR